jgi:hypothetical protein
LPVALGEQPGFWGYLKNSLLGGHAGGGVSAQPPRRNEGHPMRALY